MLYEKTFKVLVALVVVLASTSCSQKPEHESSSEDSALFQDERMFTEVPTTSVPTSATPLMATETQASNVRLAGDILFASLDTTCPIPCWNDLEIGISSQIDFIQVIENEFETTPTENTVSVYEGSTSLIFEAAYAFGPFRLIADFDSETLILRELRFVFGFDISRGQLRELYGRQYLTNPYIEEFLAPKLIITEFSAPQEVFVDVVPGGQVNQVLRFSMYSRFSNGMLVSYGGELPRVDAGGQTSSDAQYEYCVSGQGLTSTVVSIAHDSDIPDNVSPRRQELVDIAKANPTVEEVFGLDTREFAEATLNPNYCTQIEIDLSP